jgi:hypothetical protein
MAAHNRYRRHFPWDLDFFVLDIYILQLTGPQLNC